VAVRYRYALRDEPLFVHAREREARGREQRRRIRIFQSAPGWPAIFFLAILTLLEPVHMLGLFLILFAVGGGLSVPIDLLRRRRVRRRIASVAGGAPWRTRALYVGPLGRDAVLARFSAVSQPRRPYCTIHLVLRPDVFVVTDFRGGNVRPDIPLEDVALVEASDGGPGDGAVLITLRDGRRAGFVGPGGGQLLEVLERHGARRTD
jgi:hypothetical protein